MHWIDWLIVIVPFFILGYIALKSQRYVRTVADFLAAGRVAGRYVLSVANGEAAIGLITVVGSWESYYHAGFACSFWYGFATILSLFFGLFSFCNYRFRETRALTMGQFFELRYSRRLRILAAFIQSISGIINYAIFPAVGGRFLMYFLDLPTTFTVYGIRCSTFAFIMLAFLSLALVIVLMGGQITIMVTDCVQGLISYPFYAIIVFYVLYRFSWTQEMAPVLMDCPPGKSFVNPYDIRELRDFNIVWVLANLTSMTVNRMSWAGGQGYNVAAKNPHEQKMGGLLGTWRNGFSTMMYTLLAVVAFTFLHHAHFTQGATAVHEQLTRKTYQELADADDFERVRDDLQNLVQNHTATDHLKEILADAQRQENERAAEKKTEPRHIVTAEEACEPGNFRDVGAIALGSVRKKTGQTFSAIYTQMIIPVTLREILPIGITGVLCAIMIFLMVSTDTTYMHSWGSILVQDIILPLHGRPFTPKQQLRLLRYGIVGVATFAYIFSLCFSQVDFILMFFAITGAIWGGAGTIITFGLYWKRGTTAAAYTSLLSGGIFAALIIVCQSTWVSHIYPFLVQHNLLYATDRALRLLSKPFHPYIDWSARSDKFPITSMESLLFLTLLSIILYVIVSLYTCKEPFNMDKMLHRGAYADDKSTAPELPWNRNTLYAKLIGIDAQYTRGDRILAWSVFLWVFGWTTCVCFLAIIFWNFFYEWPVEWWAWKFYITTIVVPGIVAVVTTIWFFIGGTLDLRRLFRDLEKKQDDLSDNGFVASDK